MYQIVQTTPVHCQITDGIIGSRSWALPMTYLTLEFARKIACVKAEDNYQTGGDDSFRVIDTATGKFVPWRPVADVRDDEMPF